MKKLLNLIKGSPSPKQKCETRFVTIPMEEYEFLKLAAWSRGRRAEAQKRLKTIEAWKMRNGL